MEEVGPETQLTRTCTNNIENNVASEVHVKRFKSKEVGIKKLQEAIVFPCTDRFLRQEGHAQRRTSRHQRVESLDAERAPSSLGAVKGGVADFSEGDRDTMEAWRDFWKMFGEFVYRHRVMPRDQLYVPKDSSFPIPSEYTDVARQTKHNLDCLAESSVDDFWNIDGHRILIESRSGSTRFRILNNRPHPGYSWVDSRMTNAHVTSRPETIWPEVWSSVSKIAQKQAKQKWDIEEPRIQAARQKRQISWKSRTATVIH